MLGQSENAGFNFNRLKPAIRSDLTRLRALQFAVLWQVTQGELAKKEPDAVLRAAHGFMTTHRESLNGTMWKEREKAVSEFWAALNTP